jgi:hypothetical protein
MPINTVEIELEEIGYPGWVVTMRTNPRSSVYDDFIAVDEPERWWQAFGKLVLAWNFADEDGEALPLPKDSPSDRDIDLPVGIIAFIYRRYVEEFRERIGLPKVSDAAFETTSRTNGVQQDDA